MKLTVKGYGIGDNINLEYLKSVLFHELKHTYQTSLYTTSPSVPNILQIATTIISSDLYNKNNVIYLLSRLIYYFSKKEIDANIESLYQELKETKPNDLKEFMPQSISEYEYHKALYSDCKLYDVDDLTIKTIYHV